jgi:RecA-family ATPase
MLENRALKVLDEIAASSLADAPIFTRPEEITPDEWKSARATPDCIVDNYLFADVALLIAPGGMGKTTIMLFEAIHIALGMPLYGMTVRKPGPVMIVTAEDSREMLVARLRAIAQGMKLGEHDIETVMQRVRIADVSGSGFRLTEIKGDVVRPGNGIDQIIESCRAIKPVLIVVDPAVSFGIGESRVNDAEQGLVEAARKLRRALNCCVRFVHHSGKQNARDRAADQYAGRGGSAFADGARMVHVLQSLTPDEWHNETGQPLAPGETGLRLARPKMSYCAPVGDILIKRSGYTFERAVQITMSKGARIEAAADQILRLINSEMAQGRLHSKNSLEMLGTGLKRGELRAAIDVLEASGRIETRAKPGSSQRGARQYLHPVASPSDDGEPRPKTDEKTKTASPPENAVFASPPYREINGGEPTPAIFSHVFLASPKDDGEPTANRANRGLVEVIL